MTEQRFTVVVNGDGQHSMVPEDSAIPAGWTSTGFVGTHAAALQQIETLAYEQMSPEHRAFMDLQRRWQEEDKRIKEEIRQRNEANRQS